MEAQISGELSEAKILVHLQTFLTKASRDGAGHCRGGSAGPVFRLTDAGRSWTWLLPEQLPTDPVIGAAAVGKTKRADFLMALAGGASSSDEFVSIHRSGTLTEQAARQAGPGCGADGWFQL